MTSRASTLLSLRAAPVTVLRLCRRWLARVLFEGGCALMEASWRVDPLPPPAPGPAPYQIALVCEACGAERPIGDWGLGWGRRDPPAQAEEA